MGELIGKVVESTLYYVPKSEFDRVRALNEASAPEKTRIFADMCRLNTLYMNDTLKALKTASAVLT